MRFRGENRSVAWRWLRPKHVSVALAVVAFSKLAGAQDHEASRSLAEERVARDEMKKGIAAARAERWDEARVAFEHAYAITKKPSALLNLASAQSKTGRLVEASESYRTIATLDRDVDADQRKAAKEAMASIEPRLPHLRVVIRGGGDAGDVVSLDGRVLPPAVLALDLPANPGAHELTLARKGSHAPPVAFTLVEGELRAVTLVPTFDPVPAKPPPPAPESRSIFRSPWFWTGVGVVVVGATIGTVCAAGACSSSEPTPQPYRGKLGNATFP